MCIAWRPVLEVLTFVLTPEFGWQAFLTSIFVISTQGIDLSHPLISQIIELL